MDQTEFQSLKLKWLLEYPDVDRTVYSMAAVVCVAEFAFLLKERNPAITFREIQTEFVRLQKEADEKNLGLSSYYR